MNGSYPVPLYYKVAQTLKNRIKTKEYQRGDILPSEMEFEKEFDVSNITIRKAMNILVQDNYIVRKRGAGTKVIFKSNYRLAVKIAGDFRDWYASELGKNHKLKVEILNISLAPCPNRVANILSIKPDSKVWRMKRTRKIDGEPISYYINYGSPSIFGKLKKKDLTNKGFVEVFQKLCNIQLSKVDQRVEATTADIDISSILNIDFGDPVFFVEYVYYTINDDPVEVTRIYYRGDRYVFSTSIRLD